MVSGLTRGLRAVADGDFSHKIEVASRDEIGVLTDTFNDMARQLRDTLRQVENERQQAGHPVPPHDRRRGGLLPGRR